MDVKVSKKYIIEFDEQELSTLLEFLHPSKQVNPSAVTIDQREFAKKMYDTIKAYKIEAERLQ